MSEQANDSTATTHTQRPGDTASGANRGGPGAPEAGPGVRTAGNDPNSVTHLLRRLVDDVATLLRKEMALATSEVSHAIEETKTGAVSMVSGGAVLYAGLIFLLAAATLGLAEVMAPWLAALLVGAVVTLIGFVMVKSGKSSMSPRNMAPNRAAASFRRDKEIFERQHHDQHQ